MPGPSWMDILCSEVILPFMVGTDYQVKEEVLVDNLPVCYPIPCWAGHPSLNTRFRLLSDRYDADSSWYRVCH